MHSKDDIDEFTAVSEWLEYFLSNFGMTLYYVGDPKRPLQDATGKLLFRAVTEQYGIASVVSSFEETILLTLGDRVASCGTVSGLNSHDVASVVLMNIGEEYSPWLRDTLGNPDVPPQWDDVSPAVQHAIAEKERSLNQLRGEGWLKLAAALRTERVLLLRTITPVLENSKQSSVLPFGLQKCDVKNWLKRLGFDQPVEIPEVYSAVMEALMAAAPNAVTDAKKDHLKASGYDTKNAPKKLRDVIDVIGLTIDDWTLTELKT
jgi:hypothetical protein